MENWKFKTVFAIIMTLIATAICCAGIWLTLEVHLAFIPMIVLGAVSMICLPIAICCYSTY